MSWISELFYSQELGLVSGLLFLILNILDGHSTWLVIRPHHYSREKNPIARWVFKKLGLPGGIIIFKSFILSGLGLLMMILGDLAILYLNIVLSVADLVFLGVVIHNYRIWAYHVKPDELERERLAQMD